MSLEMLRLTVIKLRNGHFTWLSGILWLNVYITCHLADISIQSDLQSCYIQTQLQGAVEGEMSCSRTHRLGQGLNRQPPD